MGEIGDKGTWRAKGQSGKDASQVFVNEGWREWGEGREVERGGGGRGTAEGGGAGERGDQGGERQKRLTVLAASEQGMRGAPGEGEEHGGGGEERRERGGGKGKLLMLLALLLALLLLLLLLLLTPSAAARTALLQATGWGVHPALTPTAASSNARYPPHSSTRWQCNTQRGLSCHTPACGGSVGGGPEGRHAVTAAAGGSCAEPA